ncbi:hypothetical protein GCM10009802_05780 [Streptomyces synnematoformans]|uniref:Uncharacterized protein n=1 Tax=Streptomyces synnematoformans TaxID=415721 RepID=A0ABN2XFW1_9ACTN
MGDVVFFQPHPDPARLAVEFIDGHPPEGDPRCHSTLKHAQAHVRLGGKLDIVTDTGSTAALTVRYPLLREIQLAVDQGPPPVGTIGQEHPDLGILDPAGRPRVLPGHPRRPDALLQKSRLVEDENSPLGISDLLHDRVADVVTQSVGVPQVVVQQSLHPLRTRVAGSLRQGPAVLTFCLTPTPAKSNLFLTRTTPRSKTTPAWRWTPLHAGTT